MKINTKVRLKKIESFAMFFIASKKRVTREIPYCKIPLKIIFQQVIHNNGTGKQLIASKNFAIFLVKNITPKKHHL